MDVFIGPKHRVRRVVAADVEPPPEVTDVLLCNTDLPNKVVNQLDAAEIFTLGELAEKDSYFILDLPNMGETTLWLLKQLLDVYELPNTFGELFSFENGKRSFKRPRNNTNATTTDVPHSAASVPRRGQLSPKRLQDLDLFL